MSDNTSFTICAVCVCLLLAFGFKCCTDIQIQCTHTTDQKEAK